MQEATGVEALKRGDLIEVFFRMPYGKDNGYERLELVGERWMLCPTVALGTNRPRIGWTERWLPATVVDGPTAENGAEAVVSFEWAVMMWFDWASGDQLDSAEPSAMYDRAPVARVRRRSRHWLLTSANSMSFREILLPRGGNELSIGGVPVNVSFIVFRWGAARVPVLYDTHSWGREEGSTVSARFIQVFFDQAVVPRYGYDYEVLSVFIQHSDELPKVSSDFLASLCHGRNLVALYFLWPTQGQQTQGDRHTSTAGYIDQAPLFDLVARMEGTGIVTRWPHHCQLWKCLSGKEWVPGLSIVPKYHVPLTTRLSKSLILRDPRASAKQALRTLWMLQQQKRMDDNYPGPIQSDWNTSDQGQERCVVKLGFSYEGIDVRMVVGEQELAEALYRLITQPGYLHDCVYVQQRVHRVDLEVRCFVVDAQIASVLYTRFGRIDRCGCVRDYEKAYTAEEAMREWFENDQVAWQAAHNYVQILSARWFAWMLTQSAEPPASVRIDYMLERVGPGQAEVWTGEVGEQGYSMGGVSPAVVFNKVLDGIGDIGDRTCAN